MVHADDRSAQDAGDRISASQYCDGLQVYSGHSPEVVHDIDAVEKYPVDDDRAHVGELDNTSQIKVLPPDPKRIPWWKRWHILLITAGAVIIVAVAIIAGILGSQAAQKSASKSAASPLTSPGNTSSSSDAGTRGPHTNNATQAEIQYTASGRVKSQSGTWNATGLAATVFSQQDSSDTQLFGLVFQDHLGQIQSLTLQYTWGSSGMQVIQSTPLPIKAAPGTLLTSTLVSSQDNKTSNLVLVYANTDNIISDLWQENPPHGAFEDGTLSSLNLKVPTDTRVAAGFFTDIPGSEVLVAGQDDAKLHSYGLSVANKTWFPYPTSNFTHSWAYGGLAAASYQDAAATHWDRTLYHSTETGMLRQYNQSGTYTDNPGDVIMLQGSKVLEQPMMVNTSLALAFNSQPGSDPWMLFPTMQGRMGVCSLTWKELGGYSDALETFGVLAGSDMRAVHVAEKNYNMVFYQDEGSLIAWMAVIAGFGKQDSGHLVMTGNYSNGSQIWTSKSG